MKNQQSTIVATSEVVHCYVQLAAKVAQMVQFAQARNWGELPAAEAQCTAIVERLRVIEPGAMLDRAQSDQAQRLIRRIQADQTIVSEIVKPQLVQLVENMSALQHRKSLDKAYGQAH
ncbi:flagellar protein FliT [Variovorax sp. ZT4R33]|uniref:flagellar protein FliT n=1 Tax=Variovorax sp. ZT4R33 TaxID=3443743 RepID=UPI003F4681C7